MKPGTYLTIGLTVVVLGAGVMALGLFEEEATVRQVREVLDDPAAHAAGSYTMVGVPQPALLATFADGDDATERPNPAYRNSTQHGATWTRDGTTYLSVLTLTVDGPDASGQSTWSLRNDTRTAGSRDAETTWSNWTLDAPHKVFLIQGFDDGGEPALVFGVYEGVLRERLQPKPSQFEGHLASTLPGGVPVPDGALVFLVEEYTAGCSSKFIPEEHEGDYENATA